MPDSSSHFYHDLFSFFLLKTLGSAMLSLSIAPFKCGQCFRSYFDWNKYQSHQSLHHRNADFIVKRANLPVRNTVQPNVPTIQVNQSNVIFQQATTATKKAVIYPNRINLTDGVELVNRLKCPGSLRNHKVKSCSYETFFPEMIQHHIGTFLLLISTFTVTPRADHFSLTFSNCEKNFIFKPKIKALNSHF